MADVLYFDVESHSADDRWKMTPEEFVRLGQFAWNDGPVELSPGVEDVRDMILAADLVVGHNIHDFDLSVIFGKDSTVPLELALDKKVFDTWTHATIVNPAPNVYTNRDGQKVFDGAKPEKAKKWYALDNQAFQLGVEGKIGDLKAMAKEFGGFGEIPIDHPPFVEYAIQDVIVVREVAKKLKALSEKVGMTWEYAWREQKFAAINAQMARNGFKLDIVRAQDRVEELRQKREAYMEMLIRDYDYPTKGKAPWQSNDGKAATLRILNDFGINPEKIKDWPRNKPTKKAIEEHGDKTKGSLQLGGKVLQEFTEGTPAEEVGEALAQLMGMRTLAELALSCLQPDGKVHPDVATLQRSGRSSIQKPGLTVWSAKGKGAVEKSYFIASPGRKLVEMDYSAADARIVAAYSGDAKFAERFEDGKDAHEITGRLVFGEAYDTDPKGYRDASKPLGHGWSYRAGVTGLVRAAGKKLTALGLDPQKTAKDFITTMDTGYPLIGKWQQRVTQEGEKGWVTNDWGRRMMIDFYTDKWGRPRSRAYTQAPALYGQSGTREIMVDGLIKIAHDNLEVITWLVATVHDAVIWEIPEEHLDWAPDWILERMSTKFRPKHAIGQTMDFPMEMGPPADNWMDANH